MLIECPECKQQISDTAFFCPKCGFTRKKIWLERSEKTFKLYSVFMGLLSVIFFLISFNSKISSSSKQIYDSLKYLFLGLSILGFIIGLITNKLELKSK